MTERSASLTRAGAQARICAVDSELAEVAHEVPSLVPAGADAPAAQEEEAAGFLVWLAGLQMKLTALLERPGTLMHAQPPTFREAQVRHHECAGHYRHAPVQAGRVLYGYGHMVLIKAPLNYLEWATDAPLRLSIHAGLAALIIMGLVIGGYL